MDDRREHPECLTWLARGRAVTPGGAQTMSRQADRFVEGAFPVYLREGRGSRVWCLDGHEYVDYILGLGPLTLGYNHPVVLDAVRRQMAESGTIFSLPHPLEVTVAEQLLACLPSGREPRMVRWVKTGTEADMGAVRIARAHTGRDLVIVTGYHGWADWYVASKPVRPGIPEALVGLVRAVPFNDLDQMTAMMAANGDRVAAIMVEPVLLDPPAPGYLQGLRDLCDQYGALLIFDEVVSGFRWALGGGQEFFKVTPDLSTFGKAMAGGFPLAAIVGPRSVMDPHGILVSGTFGGETIGLAAAQAVFDLYVRDDIIVKLWGTGMEFFGAFLTALQTVGWRGDGPPSPVVLKGYEVHPQLVCRGPHAEIMTSILFQELAARGLLLHPGGFNTSAVHTPADAALVEAALTGAFRVLQAVAVAEHPESFLRGRPIQSWGVRFQTAKVPEAATTAV